MIVKHKIDDLFKDENLVDSIIEKLLISIEALKRSWSLDSPLSPIFWAILDLLALLHQWIDDGAFNLNDPAKDVSQIMVGKSIRFNWLTNEKELTMDPLKDLRTIGGPYEGTMSNPLYRKRIIPSPVIHNEDGKVTRLIDIISELLVQIMHGGNPDEFFVRILGGESPRRDPPEGKRLTQPEYWYWKRRRLLKKGQ